MLYTSEAVVLPPMTKRRVFLQAPAEVVKRGDRGVVVPAPQEAIGKATHPHVEVGAVTRKVRYQWSFGIRPGVRW